MARKSAAFHDLLPVMAEQLGGEGLINELCNGFQLLMDKEKGVITLDSLRLNSSLLGLRDMGEAELLSMMTEGDLDGDGALNQMEFCVLMFRLSPELMEHSLSFLQHAFHNQFKTC
ncbi:calcium-binding protein PBP1-like [Cucurbita pepo subsp. pepo]|uniref:calcium-binding protein PBP1-like n=1 Tax=Cucurbita pepo subsp. pepo TaxID=3664 RepID=UPI000C9D588B|nr:calcium-binding protein PBP1-like [Cucurbita pepo subsp. pepo]